MLFHSFENLGSLDVPTYDCLFLVFFLAFVYNPSWQICYILWVAAVTIEALPHFFLSKVIKFLSKEEPDYNFMEHQTHILLLLNQN